MGNMDELVEAFDKKIIKTDLFKLAIERSEKLQREILADMTQLNKLSLRCLNEIENPI